LSSDVEKKVFIKDLKEDQLVEDLFLVKEANRAETRNGKPYLIVTVMDRTGELGGRLWENVDRFMPVCRVGNIVLLQGRAQSYKGTLQLKIDTVKAVEKDRDSGWQPGDFLPATVGDVPAMAREVMAYARSVAEPHLNKLLLAIFGNRDFFGAFQQAPAAKRMHHAYYGGLLEHTLAVTRLADSMAGLYPMIDRSLLIAGALLHDIGKTEEFSFDRYPFDYTDKGRLVGHLVLGAEMMLDCVKELDSFPPELATRLQHLILSHHGRYEFGSPCLPMTLEAFILNFIDDVDAKINYLDRLGSQSDEPGYRWTDFQKTLERFLYVRGGPLPEPDGAVTPATEEAAESEEDKQQSLF
jgi:3'-5' exoribonuclease